MNAPFMATVWDGGKTRPRYLASLGGVYTVPEWVPQEITDRFPTIPIDWTAIQATLVTGPPGTAAPSAQMLDWAEVEARLRDWAQTGPEDYPGERQALRAAAQILEAFILPGPNPAAAHGTGCHHRGHARQDGRSLSDLFTASRSTFLPWGGQIGRTILSLVRRILSGGLPIRSDRILARRIVSTDRSSRDHSGAAIARCMGQSVTYAAF